MGVDKLLFLVMVVISATYFHWSIGIKGFKMLWWLLEWSCIDSTNYVNTLWGQPISVLVLRHFLLECLCNKKLLFWLNFTALLKHGHYFLKLQLHTFLHYEMRTLSTQTGVQIWASFLNALHIHMSGELCRYTRISQYSSYLCKESTCCTYIHT